MPLHPRIRAALDAAAGSTPYHALPIDEARALARKAYASSGPPVAVGPVRELAVPAASGAIAVRLYLPPATTEPPPLLVFFHGSGFVMLDLDTHDEICRRLCAGAGCAVASVDYRLAPEHRFPAGPNDCLAAARWLAAQAGDLGVDPSRLALAGDSAGGCLAAVTALRLRDEGGPSPRGLLLIYPVTDRPPPPETRGSYSDFGSGHGLTREGMEWFWGHYLEDPSQATHPHAAPLRAENFAGLPPACVLVAEYDVLRDEGLAFAERLRAAGVPVESRVCAGMNHGFLKYAGTIDEATAALDLACRWLQGVLAR